MRKRVSGIRVPVVSARGLGLLNGIHGAKPPEVHGLYNRNGDVFHHFGSAFNNMNLYYFVPF